MARIIDEKTFTIDEWNDFTIDQWATFELDPPEFFHEFSVEAAAHFLHGSKEGDARPVGLTAGDVHSHGTENGEVNQ